MKYIILSFDDSRDDFYTRVFPIIKKYNIPVTLNVISSFVEGNIKCDFPSSNNKGMNCEQVVECQKSGLVEIACHGATHKNTRNDILRNIEELRKFGCNVEGIGAASQGSEITIRNRNDDGIWDLVENGTLSYLRTGIVIRREGLLYSAISLIDMFLHSKSLYCWLNKKGINRNPSEPFFMSATIVSYNTLEQVESLIEKYLKDNNEDGNSALILMLHSILKKGDHGYYKDKWYWDERKFEGLCSYLKDNKIRVVTNRQFVEQMSK